MHDIAKAAGVTQSLIHHHFGPKDALWAEVRRHAFGQYVEQQRRLVETTAQALASNGPPSASPTAPAEPTLPHALARALPRGLAGLRAAVDDYFRFLAGNPDVLRMVAWLELDEPRALEEDLRELYGRGTEVFEALQDAGQLRRDLPARTILVALLALVRNWFDERNVVQDESDPQQVARTDAAYQQSLWTAFTEGLVATATAPA